ncbi:MAG: DUF3825 domain-containing protein [Phormidesmis sp.]
MRSLLKSISQFFQRLFHKGGSSLGDPPRRPEGRPEDRTPVKLARSTADPRVTPRLRQLLYQAIASMPQRDRTHAAQVGAILKKQDPAFSYETHSFAKLIDLLEAVPDLVTLEREDPNPDSSNSAPVYYVRPVTDTKRLLKDSLKDYDSEDGWVHVDSLMQAIAPKAPSFSAQTYGFHDFKALLENTPTLIEFKADSPSYVRLKQKRVVSRPRRLPSRRPRTVASPPRAVGRRIEPLAQFAGFSPEVLDEKVGELAAIALPENWYFGPQPPDDFAYPILRSYLRYTFIRLQHERKVIASANSRYYAFNTGLLDRLLRPIYGLFARTGQFSDRTWDLSFCIAGESSAGKALVAQFTDLPQAANYLANPEKAFYYLEAGAPQVDWQHVIKDNMARLPLAFLEQYAPAGFVPRSTDGLTTPEFFDYKQSFIDALDADSIGYRNIVSKLEEALERTLKRIQINYKTAVPTYYPKINSIDLLLPMCLVDESIVDFAIVTRREPSGKYIGHTILTMRQAYNNARLICKLDEHWLSRSMTLSQQAFDDDDDEDESSESFAAEESMSGQAVASTDDVSKI